MTTFCLDTDNNITAFATPEDVPSDRIGLETFTSQKELARRTAKWPITRFAEIWNSFAGVVPFDELKPVKKFTDRKTAVARIWKAIQRLDAATAQHAAPSAPKKPKAATKAKARDAGAQGARGQQEGPGPRTAPPARGRHARRHRGCHRLAEAQRPRLHLRSDLQEDGAHCRIPQARGRRASLPRRVAATARSTFRRRRYQSAALPFLS